MISAVDADPLMKRNLLLTSVVNVHLLQGASIDYMALQYLSAWLSYHPLRSRFMSLGLSNFRADCSAWDSCDFEGVAFGLINFFPGLEELGQHRDCFHLWHHNGPLCMFKWAFRVNAITTPTYPPTYLHKYIFGHYNPPDRITTYFLTPLTLCVLILYVRGVTYCLTSIPNNRFFSETFSWQF